MSATTLPSDSQLVGLCRRSEAADRALSGPLDAGAVARILEGAQRHGVVGLAGRRLLDSEGPGAAGLSTEARTHLEAALALVRRQSTFWEMEQGRVLGFLTRQGEAPIVLKGGALRYTVYDEPLDRTMGDLDLLVRESEVDELLGHLATLGYASKYPEGAIEGFREHHYHDRVTHANGFEVEVHWGLTRPDSLFRIPVEPFFERAEPVEPPGVPAFLGPGAVDMILHTVSQAEQGGVSSLRRLVDLDRVVTRSAVDWDRVEREAEACGLTTVLCVVLRLTELLLRTDVPRHLSRGEVLSATDRRRLAATDPLRRLLGPTSAADITVTRLFRLQCLPDPETQREAVRVLAQGKEDPLQWIWNKEDEAREGKHSRLEGMVGLAKLALVRAWLGLPLRAVSPFWSADRLEDVEE